jgi:ectoine hydroxylase
MSDGATMDDAYPSRTGAPAAIHPRLDPVVHGAKSGALSDEQRHRYDRSGYLCLQELLAPPEAERLYAELEALSHDAALRDRPELVREPDSEAVRSVFDVHKLSPSVERLVRSPELLSMIEELLGGEVYVHQSRVNYKPGFDGREFYWHSDFETWHVEDGMPRMRALSLSLNLTANTQVNGPLMVIPGSHLYYASCPGKTPPEHHKQSLRRQEYGVPTREQLSFLVEHGGIAAPTGAAGSAVLFECNTMHGSAGNITPWPRSNVFIVWNSVHNALAAPFAGIPPRPNHIANRDFRPLARA